VILQSLCARHWRSAALYVIMVFDGSKRLQRHTLSVEKCPVDAACSTCPTVCSYQGDAKLPACLPACLLACPTVCLPSYNSNSCNSRYSKVLINLQCCMYKGMHGAASTLR
jgi:hypothetical protein